MIVPDGSDDTLTLLFLCCHPALSPPSQVALTLRAVGGLTTAEIARAFLVPEATMAQRISRAKQRIKAPGAPFQLPPAAERADRLRVVLHVLYLIFNEGYTRHRRATTCCGPTSRPRRSASPAWCTRLLPDDGEVAGLLALMLLTDARREPRSRADGALVPLAEQDRSLWDHALIDEGVALVTRRSPARPLGPYQLQAAIAAVHDEAPTPRTPTGRRSSPSTGCSSGSPRTRWSPSTARSPSPRSTGPRPGSTCSPRSTTTSAWPTTTALHAVRGPPAGDGRRHRRRTRRYRDAARRTTSLPERRYLEARAARLS